MSTSVGSEYDLLSAFNPHGACDYCHKRKMRCDKTKPQCNECVKRSIQCNYGLRLKRGPKMKNPHERKTKVTDAVKKVQKANAFYNSLLFELEFNKKMVELWKNLATNGNGDPSNKDFFQRIRPKFTPATEEFIRQPNIVPILMEEFDISFRVSFAVADFATNTDFATKIWQALTDVNLTDMLTILNGFETPLLLATLEYFILFLLCLKLSRYEDISHHLTVIINHIFNLVIYARDFASDCLTSSELTIKTLVSLIHMAAYHKMTKNLHALRSNALLSYELFRQYRSSTSLDNELEARLCCRIAIGCRTAETRAQWIARINSICTTMPPHLLYMLNIFTAMQSLFGFHLDPDYSEAYNAVQRADHYAKVYIEQYPPNKRHVLEEYFESWTGVVFAEVAIKLGDVDLSRRKIGRLLEAYSRMRPSLQRLMVSNCEFFMFTMGNKALLIQDYLPLLCKGMGITMYKQPSNSTYPALLHEYAVPVDSEENSNETSSPTTDVLTASPSDDVQFMLELCDVPDPFFDEESGEYGTIYIDNGM